MAMGERWQITAHHSKLSPPCVATRASRATSGRIWRERKTKWGEDREDRATRGALDPPDGHPTQTDAHIMRMARQAPTSLTPRLVFELKAQGQEKSHHQFHKGLAVAKQLHVGRFVLKIDGDGPVFTGLAGSAAHGSPSGQMVGVADDPRWTHAFPISRGWGFTTKSGGMWKLAAG